MAVLSFLGAWNLYLRPHQILDATEHKTLSIGLELSPPPASKAANGVR
jgi:ABC-type glycerol-3-phosphate transport system permease component